jgi:hypothetical protein
LESTPSPHLTAAWESARSPHAARPLEITRPLHATPILHRVPMHHHHHHHPPPVHPDHLPQPRALTLVQAMLLALPLLELPRTIIRRSGGRRARNREQRCEGHDKRERAGANQASGDHL